MYITLKTIYSYIQNGEQNPTDEPAKQKKNVYYIYTWKIIAEVRL